MSDVIRQKFDICIVGGGAAGMVCAITAARRGKSVCIFDSNKLLGRKILSTGNGRCNLTNSEMESVYFYSDYEFKDEFIGMVLSKFSCHNVLDFFEEIGVKSTSVNGYFYPYTNQASNVREALEREIKVLNIECYLDRRVNDIKKLDNGFRILAYNVDVTAKKLVIATGGLVGDKLGCNGDGFRFAKEFGHSITALHPGLTALMFQDKALAELAGVRCFGEVLGQKGEIQFNKDSISGIPVMCLSREISKQLSEKKEPVEISVDLLPDADASRLFNYLDSKKEKYGKLSVGDAFLGLINDKCLNYCLKEALISTDRRLSTVSEKEIKTFISIVKGLKINVSDTRKFNDSQVTAGGIRLDDIDFSTMESRIVPGLYFAGEVMDVDGICGGYNLQWAFSTGYLAALGACN